MQSKVSGHAPLPCSSRRPRLPYPKFRMLLALDGAGLNRAVLSAALPCCLRLSDRVDILVVNSPKATTFLLGGLLPQLERYGVDYRLTSTEGAPGDEVVRYLRRFQGIKTVVVDSLRHWEKASGAAMAGLRRDGYRFIALAGVPMSVVSA